MNWPDHEVRVVIAKVMKVEKDPQQVSRIDPRGHLPQAILDVLSPWSGRMTGTETIIFRALENE